MRCRFWVLLVAVSVSAFAFVMRGPRSTAQPPREAAHAEPGTPPFRYLGAGSCAAAACHNGMNASGALASEYTTWAAHDPHARAYDVLFNDVSRNISRNLRRPAPAHEDPLCLNCHALRHFESHREHLPLNFARDGVSCESCHGPAEKWIAEHYRPQWQKLTVQQKKAEGMLDTQSLAGRARLCAQCHVGSKDHDVNHDLYGAGHPPLVFEFSAFHASLPHHWQDYKDKDPERSPGRGKPDFEARAWVVGQLVCAQSALELLAERAGNEKNPWPEFAETDCFACHHDLKERSFRQTPEYTKGRKAGSLRWRTWHYAMLPRAASVVSKEAEGDLDALVQRLRQDMEKPSPKRSEVSARARKTGQRLGELIVLAEKADRGPALDDLYQAILSADRARAARGWDESAQVYLSLSAFHNAWTDQKQAPPAHLRDTLLGLQKLLAMPEGFKSPANFDGAEFQKRLLGLGKKL